MGVLFLVVGCYLFWKRDDINLILLYLGSYIMIPYNQYIESQLKINILGFDTRMFLLVLLFLLVIINFKKINLDISSYFIVWILSIIFIYYLVGYYNNNIFLKVDIKIYANLILLYYVAVKIINTSDRMRKVLKYFSFFTLIYCLWAIYIYLFQQDSLINIYGDRLYSWWGRRIYFTNNSLLIISIFLSLYYLYKEKWKFYNTLVVILGTFVVVISQTQTLILIIIFNFFFVFCITIFYKFKEYKMKLSHIIIGIFSVLVFSIVISYILMSDYQFNSTLVLDIIGRFSTEAQSLDVREISNEMALKDIYENPLGYGLGKELTLYDTQGAPVDQGLFIDNAFITLAVKMGVIGFLLLASIVLKLSGNLIRLYAYSKDIFYLLFIGVYATFVIIIAVMNAQIIYSPPVSATFIIIYAVMKNAKSIKNETPFR